MVLSCTSFVHRIHRGQGTLNSLSSLSSYFALLSSLHLLCTLCLFICLYVLFSQYLIQYDVAVYCATASGVIAAAAAAKEGANVILLEPGINVGGMVSGTSSLFPLLSSFLLPFLARCSFPVFLSPLLRQVIPYAAAHSMLIAKLLYVSLLFLQYYFVYPYSILFYFSRWVSCPQASTLCIRVESRCISSPLLFNSFTPFCSS